MTTLTLIDKAFYLKKCIPFHSLNLNLLLAIADKFSISHYKANETIFDCGTEGNRLFFIYSGQVSVTSPNFSTEYTLKDLDFFGEESIFNHHPRGYRVITQTETKLLTLSRTHLYAILLECPSVSIGFLQNYAATIDFRLHK